MSRYLSYQGLKVDAILDRTLHDWVFPVAWKYSQSIARVIGFEATRQSDYDYGNDDDDDE